MIAFRRLSTGPTFLDRRIAATALATTRSHPAPIAAGCRVSTLQVPQAQKLVGLTWQSRLSPSRRIRRVGRAVAIRACFLGASCVLAAARLGRRTGLLGSGDVATALRWSSRLVATGMRLWRRGRLRARL
jgi:hypothetical protein